MTLCGWPGGGGGGGMGGGGGGSCKSDFHKVESYGQEFKKVGDPIHCLCCPTLEGTPLSHRGQTTHVVGGCNTDFKIFMTWDCLIC